VWEVDEDAVNALAGILIGIVEPGGTADSVGIHAGSVLLKIENEDVSRGTHTEAAEEFKATESPVRLTFHPKDSVEPKEVTVTKDAPLGMKLFNTTNAVKMSLPILEGNSVTSRGLFTQFMTNVIERILDV